MPIKKSDSLSNFANGIFNCFLQEMVSPSTFKTFDYFGHLQPAACQQVAQACQFHYVAASLLRSGLIVATCHLHNKPVEIINFQQVCRQLVTSLLTNCDRLVVKSCRKPCERILISACCNKLLQDVNRLVRTCAFLAM